jgi:O-antigen ligase
MPTFIFAISALSLVAAGSRLESFASFASLGGIIIFICSGVRLRGAWYYLAPAGVLLLRLLAIAILLVDLSSRP